MFAADTVIATRTRGIMIAKRCYGDKLTGYQVAGIQRREIGRRVLIVE
jgi:hypothetical protein